MFVHYNNTWEEVFVVRWPVSLFNTIAVKRIFGADEDSFSSIVLADYIREKQLKVNWSIIPGIDATHHCFVRGSWNSASHQLVCSGPTIDVPLNQTTDSFQRFILSSLGYNSSDSLELNFLNYKADMQLLHGHKKRQWAKYYIIRIRLPSFYQLTGRYPTNEPCHKPCRQISPFPDRANELNLSSDECSKEHLAPRFVAIRAKEHSLLVKLTGNCPLPKCLITKEYHRPLYLKWDPVSNECGYWIGRNSELANNLTYT